MCLVQFQYNKTGFSIHNFLNGVKAQSSRGSNPIKLYIKNEIDDQKSLLVNFNDAKLNSIKRVNFAIAHGRMTTVDNHFSNEQPLFSNCGNYLIAFNGTIFNYIEIRDQLKSLGVIFNSNGDTEVLLQSFIQWGAKGIKKLNGQFAFIIFDIKKN